MKLDPVRQAYKILLDGRRRVKRASSSGILKVAEISTRCIT